MKRVVQERGILVGKKSIGGVCVHKRERERKNGSERENV